MSAKNLQQSLRLDSYRRLCRDEQDLLRQINRLTDRRLNMRAEAREIRRVGIVYDGLTDEDFDAVVLNDQIDLIHGAGAAAALDAALADGSIFGEDPDAFS